MEHGWRLQWILIALRRGIGILYLGLSQEVTLNCGTQCDLRYLVSAMEGPRSQAFAVARRVTLATRICRHISFGSWAEDPRHHREVVVSYEQPIQSHASSRSANDGPEGGCLWLALQNPHVTAARRGQY